MKKKETHWVFYNPNPLQKYKKDGTPYKWNQCDCVIRAISKFTARTWDDTYKDMCEKSIKAHMVVNDRIFSKSYLTDMGAVYNSFARGTIKPTVNEFIGTHPTGCYLLSLASHLVTVEDGKIYDTWDCGNEKIHSYYSK